MQLLRLGEPGAERPYVRNDGRLFELSGITADIDGAFLSAGGIDGVRAALERGELAESDDPGDGTGLRVGPPIARPSAVVCIGMNYAAHAAETGAAVPEHPVVFLKTPNTVVGAYDDVLLPRGSARTDWEVELAVVMGQRARYLGSVAEARQAIAGYAISNDVSEREFQLELSGGQFSKGKCAETFNPLGPWLVPAADVSDPANLRLTTQVNGEARQDSSTADMVFAADFLVWHLSQFLVLEAGDIVNTGTPQGVALSGRFPYLRDGDVMELEITGLGVQRQRCRSA